MNQKRIDIMVDLETLGTKSTSPIFQISAMAFNLETGEIFSAFSKTADISSESLTIDGSTLLWWLKTDAALLTKLLSQGEGSTMDLLKSFNNWMTGLMKSSNQKDVYLWGNGILFDNKMIAEQFAQAGLVYPIFYRNDRDVRTLLELASISSGLSEDCLKSRCQKDEYIKHDALCDVKFQIDLSVLCYNLIKNKRMYTGLFDKEGTPIMEDDILIIEDFDDQIVEKKVFYRDGAYRVNVRKTHDDLLEEYYEVATVKK